MDKRRKATKEKKILLSGILFLAVGGALLLAARAAEGFADWYSSHIYTVFVNVIGRLMGQFPFSVSEILLYVLLGYALWWIVKCITLRCMGRKVKWKIKEGFISLFLLASVLFFLYVLNCGVNYYRETFSESEDIVTREYSVEELKEVCRWLTDKVNETADQVSRDTNGRMTLESVNVEQDAVASMEDLSGEYKALQGFYPRPKALVNHWILSVQNLTGVYSPFTVEANYNAGMVDYNIPFTACHELSHLRGFMEEKEANYIGFLACIGSDIEAFSL